MRLACLHSILISAAVFTLSVPVSADDWPQWRGPTRDGVWRETGLVSSFDGDTIEPLWRQPISSGYTGPTVANGRVYVADYVHSSKPQERVLCFDADTGEPLWTRPYDCAYVRIKYTAGPRACVTIDEGRAHSLGSMGHYYCLDAKTGDIVWSRDLNTDYNIGMPIWAISCSPLIEGEIVILQIGGDGACLVALNKKTGKEVWRALNDRASYSAPIIIEQGGKRVVACMTGERVVGVDPQTGRLYWDHPFGPSKMPIGVPSPVLSDGMLFVSAFYDGAMVLRVDPERPATTKVWRRQGQSERMTDALHCMISTPYVSDGHVYGVDSYGQFRCLELATGDRLWENAELTAQERWGNAHLVSNGDRLWVFNELGELIICQVSPKGYTEIDRAKLIRPTLKQLAKRGGVAWSHPAFAERRIFIRNDEEILCADLAAE